MLRVLLSILMSLLTLATSINSGKHSTRSPKLDLASGSLGFFFASSASTGYSISKVDVCGDGTIILSSCSQYDGSYTGDPALSIYASDATTLLAYNNNYCGSGPQVNFTLNSASYYSSSSCSTLNVRASCYSYPCSMSVVYYWTGSTAPTVTNHLTSSSNSASSSAPIETGGLVIGLVIFAVVLVGLCVVGTFSIFSCFARMRAEHRNGEGSSIAWSEIQSPSSQAPPVAEVELVQTQMIQAQFVQTSSIEPSQTVDEFIIQAEWV